MRLELPAPPVGTVELEPLCPRPFDEAAWRRKILGRAGAAVASRLGATVTGFALELVETADAIVAFYAFIDHVAAAIVRAPAGHRDEIVEFLHQGRPDWSGPIVSLADVWD